MPEDVKGTYDRLIKGHGADGLAGVVGHACQQCRTTMTEDKRDVLASGKFLTCSNCGPRPLPGGLKEFHGESVHSQAHSHG